MSDTFTREDAVQAIIAMDNPQPEPAASEATTEETTATQAEEEISSDTTTEVVDDTSEAQSEPGDGETETEEQPEQTEVEPIDAPNWWDADAKGRFAELSPELQEIVKIQEDKREAITQKAKQEASEARKNADAEAKKLASLAERAENVLDSVNEVFKSKWDGMTPEVWAELAATDPETAFQLKLEYDADKERLSNVRAAQAETAKVTQEQHFSEQRTRLLEINPKLATDQKQLEAVGSYIVSNGIPVEVISSATADELNIVWKAMQYDSMMAKARAVKEAPPVVTKPAPQKSLAPAASRETPLPPQQREVQQIKNRLAQTGSRDDLAALFKTGAFG